ncbi:HTH-type transcriptional repressor CzrA [BD1-7 clade bacterium]|uniref:HTH-type transcriptional repressor CzrA n=1 Tax=BD1-7 clade bacterium TaxID=2029982 RepID=A0A5S9QEA8_9GAMM|nr:HTH-type transcriptional repressor CzrA [BD1-7 clade bacterium]
MLSTAQTDHGTTELDCEQLATFLKASADLLRLQILRVLSGDSFSVQELCEILGAKQSAISHHLKLLASAQLVTTRREGNSIFYRRHVVPHDHPFAALHSAIATSVDGCQLNPGIAAGILRIEAERLKSTRAFFQDNANRFREQQDLIASFEQYADSVTGLLQAIATPSRSLAIEIGPGEGLYLDVLARQFDQVRAYDTSSLMIKKSQQALDLSGHNNVELFVGDIRQALYADPLADCVVVNMVLHHVASPADIFVDAGALLRPGGALLITDLCHHDQTWARDACGDVWLGFEPDDLSFWAAKAGLAEGQSSYLAQRNGFRIQIRHFYKPEENSNE